MLRAGFVNWDDDTNFLHNPFYRGLGLQQLTWMFTTFHMGHYQPLACMTLGFDFVVWGMNPTGYHLTSQLFHAANTVLCFVFFKTLLRRMRGEGPGLDLAAAAGALFYGLHPLRVESVAWVTERRYVLCGFFLLLSLLREPEPYAIRGRARQGKGDLDGALADYETALRIANPAWPHRKTVEAMRDRVRALKPASR